MVLFLLVQRLMIRTSVDIRSKGFLESSSDQNWYGGFASLQPVSFRNYLPFLVILVPIFLAILLITAAGARNSRHQQIVQRSEAEQYWKGLIASQKKGWMEEGDCFYYAIKLRDLLRTQGVEADFNFVHWKEMKEGPGLHVYLSAKLLGETWVMDNMGCLKRFPRDTPPAQWLPGVVPSAIDYEYVGNVGDMVSFVSRGTGT